jgi:hypothetical protein
MNTRERRQPKVRFTLTLEGDRGNETAHLRTLRHLLKFLLRARSLKCLDAREMPDEEPHE